MLNNKAQAIVVFVFMFPLLILLISYVYDVTNINYERNKVDGIASMIRENYTDEEVCEIAYKNDNDISCSIDTVNNKITLNKKVKSIFGKFVDREYYDIVVVIEK